MKKHMVLLVAAAGLSLSAWSQGGDISQFKWLPGSWSGDDGQGTFSENWRQVNPELLTATGCYVIHGDTVLRELLRIERIGKFWAYIPVIDDNPPVLFTLVSSINDTWVFENKEHDFPQRVIYSRQADGSLKAWIEGVKEGKMEKEEYVMKRLR